MTIEKAEAKAVVEFFRENEAFGINPNFNLDALKDWTDDNPCGANYHVVYNDGGIRPYTAREFSQIAFSDSCPLIRKGTDHYEVLMVGREFVTLNAPEALAHIKLSYEELMKECSWPSGDFCGVVIWPKELLGYSPSAEHFIEKIRKRKVFLDNLTKKHKLGGLQ